MGLFNKLFSGNQIKDDKPKKTEIAEFFKIDIKNILDDTFTKGETINNGDGTFVKKYHKELNYKECEIFDNVEVTMIGNSSNVSFIKYNLNTINVSSIKKLINEIYELYGKDDEGKARFNHQDEIDFKDVEMYILFGRRWTDFPKFKYPVAIERDEDNLRLTIWGTNK